MAIFSTILPIFPYPNNAIFIKTYNLIRKPVFNALFECKGNFYPRNIGTDRILRVSGLVKQGGLNAHAQVIVDSIGVDEFSIDIRVDRIDKPKSHETYYTKVAVPPIGIGGIVERLIRDGCVLLV